MLDVVKSELRRVFSIISYTASSPGRSTHARDDNLLNKQVNLNRVVKSIINNRNHKKQYKDP